MVTRLGRSHRDEGAILGSQLGAMGRNGPVERRTKTLPQREGKRLRVTPEKRMGKASALVLVAFPDPATSSHEVSQPSCPGVLGRALDI